MVNKGISPGIEYCGATQRAVQSAERAEDSEFNFNAVTYLMVLPICGAVGGFILNIAGQAAHVFPPGSEILAMLEGAGGTPVLFWLFQAVRSHRRN